MRGVYNLEDIIKLIKLDEKVDFRDFGVLFQNYLEKRANDISTNKKCNVYFLESSVESMPWGWRRVFNCFFAKNGSSALRRVHRGGGNSDSEIFVGLDISGDYNDKLDKYETYLTPSQKNRKIIEFLYEVEHEITHEVQRQQVKSGIVNSDNLNIVKDYMFIDFWDRVAPLYDLAYVVRDNRRINPEVMYKNAHNELFIEIDDCNSAYEHTEKLLIDNDCSELIPILKDIHSSRTNVGKRDSYSAVFVDPVDNSILYPFTGPIDDLVDYTFEFYKRLNKIVPNNINKDYLPFIVDNPGNSKK